MNTDGSGQDQAEYFDRPVFIVAAPRSGSTFLFETLALSSDLWTIGGEGHELFEGIPGLRPGSPGVTSNRLSVEHVTPAVANTLRKKFLHELRDSSGQLWREGEPRAVRILEKTPKNSLRIPFINAIFPDALFVYLYRNPRDNLSSMISAWKSGNFRTYSFTGWKRPWSLLLPPDWNTMKGKPLADIAAFQWNAANRFILNDLDNIPRERWMALSYDDLRQDTPGLVEQICKFSGIPFDADFRARVSADLPMSRHTLTPPREDKWREYEAELAIVLPRVEDTFERAKQAAGQGAD